MPRTGLAGHHKLDEPLPCGGCAQHHCEIRVNSFEADVDHSGYKGAYRERRIDAYDERRKTDGDAAETIGALDEMQATLLTGVSAFACDVGALRKILMSSADDATKDAQLKALYPFLKNADSLQPSPTSVKVPFHVNVIKTLRLFNKGLDLWDQFDLSTGKPVGHDPRYTREAATWLQNGKFSGLPINVILLVVMTHVNAAQHRKKAHALIDQLANLVSAFSPLD